MSAEIVSSLPDGDYYVGVNHTLIIVAKDSFHNVVPQNTIGNLQSDDFEVIFSNEFVLLSLTNLTNGNNFSQLLLLFPFNSLH